MPKQPPLAPPATPLALQPHHLLSPPPDRLTNTPTTLIIANIQDETTPSTTSIIHHLHTHEPPNSPNRQTPLFAVNSKQWPNTTRLICDTDGTPLLCLRRIWFSGIRKWGLRLPETTGTRKKKEKQRAELLEASVPWTIEGPGRIGVGRGCRLDVKFVNALRPELRMGSSLSPSVSVSNPSPSPSPSPGSVSHLPDAPPPYTASVNADSAGVGVGVSQGAVPRAGKYIPFPFSGPESRTPIQPRTRPAPTSASAYNPASTSPSVSSSSSTSPPPPPTPPILPTYDSVRRDSPNTLRDLLDAIEPPQEPAALVPRTESSADVDVDAGSGSTVELRVVQLATVGMGVMLGNDMIVRVTRCISVDYSRSKPRARVRWQVEVAEGVDLLLVSFMRCGMNCGWLYCGSCTDVYPRQ
jgi:hypothetical protein